MQQRGALPLTNSSTDSFPISDRNRVKRMHERGAYDHAAVYAVLDAGILCHVAYSIDDQPYCTPTIHWREGDRLYWHGSSASRMLRHLQAGVRACLTVSHLDGLVLARSGFNHSVNYRSALCFGEARIVEGREEKAAALTGLINRFYPDRAGELRPINPQEIKATTVIAMTIDEASVKVRAKGVADDEVDYDHPAWAGVIPIRTIVGADEPCPRLDGGVPRPDGLAPYRDGRRLDEILVETQRRYDGC